MKPPAIAIVGATVVVAAVFWIGHSMGVRSAGSPADTSASITTEELLRELSRRAPERDFSDGFFAGEGAWGNDLEAPVQERTAEEIERELRSMIASGAATTGASGAESLWKAMAKKDPMEALSLAANLSSVRERREAVGEILQSWAEVDGPAALAWLEREGRDLPFALVEDYLRSLLSGYSASDSGAAMAFAMQLGEQSGAERRLKTTALRTVLGSLVSDGNVNAAFNALSGIENAAMQNRIHSDLVRDWGRIDPVAAAQYLDALGEDAPPRAHSSLVRSWVETNPSAAAMYVSSLGVDHPDFGRATSSLIAQWTEYDIIGPGEWLNSLPASPEVDRAVAIYTARATREDPEGAMSWAASIQNERLRSRMVQRVASDWKEMDPAAFDTFLQDSDLSDQERQRLVEASPSDGRGGRGGWGRW